MAEHQMPNQTNEVTKNDTTDMNLNTKPGDPGYSGGSFKEQVEAQNAQRKGQINVSVPSSEPPKEEEKSIAKKIFGTFFAGNMKDAGKYVKEKVLGPDLAQLAFKMFSNMLSMLLFDKPTSGSPAATSTTPAAAPTTTYKHYSTYSTSPQAMTPPFDVKTIEFNSEADIENLIGYLMDIAREQSRATLADLLEYCGLESSAVSNKWGWYRIGGYSTFERNGKYHLEMPSMTYFNR